MRVIGQAHTLVHENGVVRVQTGMKASKYRIWLRRFSKMLTPEVLQKACVLRVNSS